MKSWIDSDTGNIWLTSVGCSRHIALSTGLMRRLWGDCYRNSGGSVSLSFSAEKGVGWRGWDKVPKLCQQQGRCSRSGEGCGLQKERSEAHSILVDDS